MQSNHDEQLLAGIIKKLEKGVPPWRQPWTDASNYALIGGNKHFGNSWPSNVRAPKVPFGVYNGVMLLMAANIDGYKTNLWIAQKAVKELGAELDPPKSAPRKIRAHFNGTDSTVYNIEQVKDYESVLGLSLKIEKSDIEVQHKKSEKLLEKLKDQKGLCVKHGQDRAFYNSSSDIIGMPEVSQFLKVDKKNGESFYWATLWHETVHWAGRRTVSPGNLAGASAMKIMHLKSWSPSWARLFSAPSCKLAPISKMQVISQAGSADKANPWKKAPRNA